MYTSDTTAHTTAAVQKRFTLLWPSTIYNPRSATTMKVVTAPHSIVFIGTFKGCSLQVNIYLS